MVNRLDILKKESIMKNNMKKYKYNRTPKKRLSKDLSYERSKLMYQYRTKQGMTLERIGRMFKLTRERVRQIIDDFEEEMKQRTLNLDK